MLDLRADALLHGDELRRMRVDVGRADAREVVVGRRDDAAAEAEPAGLEDGLHERHVAGDVFGAGFVEVALRDGGQGLARLPARRVRGLRVEPRHHLLDRDV